MATRRYRVTVLTASNIRRDFKRVALASSPFIVWLNNVPQRSPAVLDPTGRGQDAFTPTRRDAGSMDHLHVVLSALLLAGYFYVLIKTSWVGLLIYRNALLLPRK